MNKIWQYNHKPNLPRGIATNAQTWSNKDLTLLLRTQIHTPHKLASYKMDKTMDSLLSAIHETHYAIEILTARINMHLIPTTKRVRIKLKRYFNDTEEMLKNALANLNSTKLNNPLFYIRPIPQVLP